VKAIGLLTTTLVGAVAVLAAVVVVKSMPDIQRYLKIRSM
jgi:hypothetical protein